MTEPAADHRHLMSVLHAAELTGPPLFALRLLRWIREERPSWTLSTVFLDAGGPLVEAFDELGPTIVRGRAEHGGGGRRERLRLDHALRTQLRAMERPSAVHVHCAGSMRVVPQLPRAPVLCHVHEMSVGLDFHVGSVARAHLPGADRYVAVSDAARTALLERFDLPAAAVDRQWGFVDRAAFDVVADRAALGVAPDDLAVVASGVRNWRKAPELFVRAAARARALHPDLPWRFVWIGGDDRGVSAQLAERAGLGDLVRFLPHVENPLALIAAADLFVLTAREDAFPLVCVEAAALGRPLVSFDSGGTDELIRTARCGLVARFPDVDELVTQMAELARDAGARDRMGRAGQEFARRHLSIEQAGPRLLATIEATMGRAR